MPTPPKTTVRAQLQVLAVGCATLSSTCVGEFARRRRGPARAPAAGAARTAGIGAQSRCSIGSANAGGLAGAGLRGAQQVAAREHERDGLRLDRRGRGVAVFGDGAQQRVGQAERARRTYR
jgi:hypothetical protein